MVIYRMGSSAIDRRAEAEVAENAQRALGQMWANGEAEAGNTWVVNPDEEWSNPLADTWVEPPLFTLAAEGRWGPAFLRFEQDATDGPWLGLAVPVGEGSGTVLVTTIDLAPYRGDRSTLIRTLGVGLVVGLGAIVAIGWWAAGRSLEPAQKALMGQRDFIADAAHELRTPLAVIQASASHALSRERPADEYRQSLGEIRSAAERAGSGVSELLEFARLEAGQAEPRRVPLRLDLLVGEVVAGVRTDDVVIEVRPASAVAVDADYSLLRQVIENVTGNAIVRASKVDLVTTVEGSWASVAVVDNGPGFDEGFVEHVFERFRRGDQQGSSGLGMAIARSIVEAHGGRCEAENSDSGGPWSGACCLCRNECHRRESNPLPTLESDRFAVAPAGINHNIGWPG
ncbi:MAG: HAMP domain-containing histidine kinase [Actinomycetia bacterium]|nr:HAMP domain-containing histidine kinase [Actinomycetes bacterium]